MSIVRTRSEVRIREVFRKTSISNIKAIKSYKSLSKLDFIEFPKLGLKELKKITKKITELNGCVLLVDYGYRKSNNENTQSTFYLYNKICT